VAEGLVVDVGITGHQGMLVTGGCCGAVSTDSAVVRVAGSAYRLATQEFLELLRDDEDGMMKFLSLAEIRQQKMAKNLACSHHHSVQQRVAKLLLQLMDLIGDNRIALTHQEMADSLGTRREAVSNMLKKLEQAGILHILRGAVDVQDRSLLMDHACACYEELLAIQGP
jgi:CRP-like cAMP-binding protein